LDGDLTGFLGGEDLPGVDLAIFVLVDAPATAAFVHKAELIGFLVPVRVDVPIDFDAVAVVTPLIDDVISIRIEISPEDLTFGAKHHPTRGTSLAFHADFAIGNFFFRWNIVGDILLRWAEGERHVNLGRVRGGTRQRDTESEQGDEGPGLRGNH